MKADVRSTTCNLVLWLRAIQIVVLTHGASGRRSETSYSLYAPDADSAGSSGVAKAIAPRRSSSTTAADVRLAVEAVEGEGIASETPPEENIGDGRAKAPYFKYRTSDARSVHEARDRDDLSETSHVGQNLTNAFSTALPAKAAPFKTRELSAGMQTKTQQNEADRVGRITTGRIDGDSTRARGEAFVELSEWTRRSARLLASTWTQQPVPELVGAVIGCLFVMGLVGTVAWQYVHHHSESNVAPRFSTNRIPRQGSKSTHRSSTRGLQSQESTPRSSTRGLQSQESAERQGSRTPRSSTRSLQIQESAERLGSKRQGVGRASSKSFSPPPPPSDVRRRSMEEMRADRSRGRSKSKEAGSTPQTDPELLPATTYKERRLRKAHSRADTASRTSFLLDNDGDDDDEDPFVRDRLGSSLSH
jgi:hypothetical protein